MPRKGEATMTDVFDGDAISRADREFLVKISDHPLMRNPLYSVPPPPSLLTNYVATLASAAAIEAAENARFAAALDWMLVNYAFCKSAFMGKSGIISLVDGEMVSIASMRGFMLPYMIEDGRKKRSVVDAWMRHPLRAHNSARSAAANLRGGQPRRLQSLLAAVTSDERRRARDL
jgi:hypothetical protein